MNHTENNPPSFLEEIKEKAIFVSHSICIFYFNKVMGSSNIAFVWPDHLVWQPYIQHLRKRLMENISCVLPRRCRGMVSPRLWWDMLSIIPDRWAWRPSDWTFSKAMYLPVTSIRAKASFMRALPLCTIPIRVGRISTCSNIRERTKPRPTTPPQR